VTGQAGAGRAIVRGVKVVVTGGSGKVGWYVVQDLVAAGHEVVILDRHRPPEWGVARSILLDLAHAGEVFDAFGMIKPEGVVHLAANPQPKGFTRHKQFVDNVAIAHSVFQASGDFGVRRIVYASSEQANGWSSHEKAPPIFPFDEDVMIAPGSAYALSKLLGETMAESLVATHPETSVVSLRLNFVQIPGHYPSVSRLEQHARWFSANFWAYIDARDAAVACRLALEAYLTGHRAYMVAADDTFLSIPTQEAVRNHFGDVPFRPGWPEMGSTVDSSRIKRELGWSPKYSWRTESEP